MLKRKKYIRQLLNISLVPLFLLLGGCACHSSLETQYAGNGTVVKLMTAPDGQILSEKAGNIKNPLIKPVTIDLADGVSPDEAAIIAVISNPALKAERAKKAIAAAQVIQAGILPNPLLSLSYEIPTGGATQGTFNAYGIGMDWDITALITREARLSSAGFNQRAVNLNVAWKEWQIAEAARLHWFKLYWNMEKRALLKEWSDALEREVKVLASAVHQGIETAPVLASARAALLEIQAAMAKNMDALQQERAELKRAMGMPPDYNFAMQEAAFSLPFKPSVIDQIDRAAKDIMFRRLDIMALRSACRSSDEHVRETVLSQFPKIGLGFLHASDTGDVITTGPSMSLEIPFFDRRQGEVAMARASRAQAIDEYRARIFEAISLSSEIKNRLDCSSAHYAKAASAVAECEKMLDVYRKALVSGNVDLLTYYLGLISLLQQKILLLDIKMGISELIVAMEAATGTHVQFIQGASGKASL